MRIVTLVVALFLGLTASAAHAGKGVFEAPMLSAAGVEVGEGKIERDGTVKGEVAEAAAGTYTLCVHAGLGLVNIPIATDTLDAPGELKLGGDLVPMTLAMPCLSFHEGSDCTGPDVYVSGLTVTD